MATENLYNLVNQATTSQDKQSKIQIGYTVDNYNGVLAALQLAIDNGAVGDLGGSAVGDDLSGLGKLRWDNNGFSEDTNACLWRMELGLFGTLPIESKEFKQFHIVKVRGNEEGHVAQTGCVKTLPFYLNTEQLAAFGTDTNFTVGCYVDVNGQLVHYMNKFFTGTMAADSETGSAFKFTADHCWQLINNKCLVAQIIPEGGTGGSAEALVIGQVIGSSSKINVNPAFFATGNAQQMGVQVSVSGANENDIILPTEGAKYRCPVSGSYKTDTGVIQNFNHANFRTWCNRAVDAENTPIVEIDQLQTKNYHVRIYIPMSKRAAALKIIPSGVPDTIFQTYSAARYGEGNIPAGVNADVAAMMRAITQACVKRGLKLYTEKDVKDARGCPTAMGSDGSWIGARGRSTAMAGYFFIPKGWPMSKINQNYGSRSAADQRAKGHPKQTGSTAVPWVEPDDPDRLDSALNHLDAAILSGSKSREWYQQRIEKANKGCVKIYCNSKTADKFQRLFNEMWDTYSDAATIYNTGKPAEEHVSAGEILLRCAPCICAINGTSGVHRSRKNKKGQWRQAGHDGGSAIDFDPSHNGTTGSKSVNCNRMEIGKHMEVGYRPLLAILYKLGGGWGGSYRFCDGLFDAMHVQF